MIGTSKMFGKISGANFGKALKGKVRYSDNMRGGDEEKASADVTDINVSRDFMTRAYEVNEWIRAIVDLTIERACQVEVFPMPINFSLDSKKIPDSTKRHMETVAHFMLKPNRDGESFYDLRKKVKKDILIYDEAGMQIVKDPNYAGEDQKISLWTNVSGEELFVNPNKDGTLRSTKTYVQMRNQKVIAHFNKNDFMNFIKNRRAGYANGLSPISSVALSILGDFEMMNFNYKFFENNARPNIGFVFENLGFGKGKGALEKAKTWYKREHQGKPHLPLFMGSEKGSVKLIELKNTHKDMEFTNWELILLSRIMSVYGMQPMVLGVLTDTTGKLNSEVQTEQFKRNAIIPLMKIFLHTFNASLIWNDANLNYDDIYLDSTNLDIDDEKKQGDIDKIYLDHGVITINQVRARLQMPPVDWGDEPFVPLNYAPLSILEEFQRAKIEAASAKDSDGSTDNNATIDPEESNKSYVKKNFKVPTGLEKIEPTKLKEIVTKIVRDMESKTSYSFPTGSNNILNSIGKYGLNKEAVL
jgi:hypothetical protein